MGALTVTAKDVRPLPGALCRRFTAGATVNAGNIVRLDTSGDVCKADAVTLANSRAIGVAVADNDGSTIFADGDPVDVCMFGPLAGVTSAYEGSFVYVSTTIGGMSDALAGSGNYLWVLGVSLSTSIIFVNPFTYDIAQQTG